MGKWVERALVAVGPLFMLFWLVGWLAKDVNTWTRWAFFIPAFAPLLLGGIWLFATSDSAPVPSRAFVKGTLFIAFAKMILVDMQWNPHVDTPPDSVSVVQWNVARRTKHVDRLFEVLSTSKPDICLLSEAPRTDNIGPLALKHLGLPYFLPDAGMALCSRYPLEFRGSIAISGGRAWCVRASLPNGPMDIVAFDLVSRPDLDRHTPMRELSDWIARRRSPIPLLVLGDFNTPRDSLSFKPLRKHLVNTYEQAGSGWPYTWPFPVPAYSIDNAWVSPGVQVFNHRHAFSRLSDHLRMTFELRLPAVPSGVTPEPLTNQMPSGW